jgi:xylan 1,4-beta-xylosidase
MIGSGVRGDRFRNPILPGSHPDPSICRVGRDYYIVTSTFEYFPGLPVHHSRDLVNWHLLGHVLSRPEQLNLDRVRPSGGLYAPTIRHAGGVFYVACTLVGGTGISGNFIVTATDPAGPWSDPIWIEGADGFDPSLFFDHDDRVWYCGTAEIDPGADTGLTVVWVHELDRLTLQLMGERHDVHSGALRGARWAEGPHLYRVGSMYYLIAAEGGTSFDHAVVVARSTSVTGPYVGCPRNPVLTARYLGANAPIVATGHADLVQTPEGDWWAVLLGVRDGETGNLGRETFLTPVAWDDEWPVFNPGVGQVLLNERRPALVNDCWPSSPRCDSFDDPELAPSWMFVRTPRERWWSLTERPGHLRLQLRPEGLASRGNPSFVARRLEHRQFSAYMCIDVQPQIETEVAGLALYRSDDYQIRFEVSGVGRRVVRVWRRVAGIDEVVGERGVDTATVRLGVETCGADYEFRVADRAGLWHAVARIDAGCLSTRVAGGFFGVVIGVYATSGTASTTSIAPTASTALGTTVADVDWFEYSGVDP